MDAVTTFQSRETELSVLGSLLMDPAFVDRVIDDVIPQDFFFQDHRRIFEAMQALHANGEPVDAFGVRDELRGDDAAGMVYDLVEYVPTATIGDAHLPRLKRYSWLRNFVKIPGKILDMQEAGASVDEMYGAAQSFLMEIAPTAAGDALLRWDESFPHYDRMLAHLAELPLVSPWDWPWGSWNQMLTPAEPGLLHLLAGGDGMGKTTWAECIAEHWARRGCKVVFVHFELSKTIMLHRRMARHAGIPFFTLRTGRLSDDQAEEKRLADGRLQGWAGNIHYLDTPGWTMPQVLREVERMIRMGDCDAVVFDYLDKVKASAQQVKLYGANTYSREADNVEALKTFAERHEIRVLALTQLNKVGKGSSAKHLDRVDMRGSGEKSEKANVVVLLHRERLEDGTRNGVAVTAPGGYDPLTMVRVDKNTMGRTGAFKQLMQPEFFRVGDVTPVTFGGTND